MDTNTKKFNFEKFFIYLFIVTFLIVCLLYICRPLYIPYEESLVCDQNLECKITQKYFYQNKIKTIELDELSYLRFSTNSYTKERIRYGTPHSSVSSNLTIIDKYKNHIQPFEQRSIYSETIYQTLTPASMVDIERNDLETLVAQYNKDLDLKFQAYLKAPQKRFEIKIKHGYYK